MITILDDVTAKGTGITIGGSTPHTEILVFGVEQNCHCTEPHDRDQDAIHAWMEDGIDLRINSKENGSEKGE